MDGRMRFCLKAVEMPEYIPEGRKIFNLDLTPQPFIDYFYRKIFLLTKQIEISEVNIISM